MKISMKRLGWIALAIVGCKVAVHAQDPKMVTKAYQNNIIGIVQEPIQDGFIVSFALEKTPVICNQIFDSYEDSISLQSFTYFLPLTEPKTAYIKEHLLKLADNFADEGFSMKISFEQFPIKGILVAVTLDSGYTIEKIINQNVKKISFVIAK